MTYTDDNPIYALLELLQSGGYVVASDRDGRVQINTNGGEYVTTLMDKMPGDWISAIKVVPLLERAGVISSPQPR